MIIKSKATLEHDGRGGIVFKPDLDDICYKINQFRGTNKHPEKIIVKLNNNIRTLLGIPFEIQDKSNETDKI